ncbi:MAG: hypothetical protein LBC27_06020, partial [Spirochaetaceae bacterium]|nr:hypothetical protein [Spirochaetaceae bacterium]
MTLSTIYSVFGEKIVDIKTISDYHHEKCRHKTFVENYTYNACDPNIRSRIFGSIVNGSGMWA